MIDKVGILKTIMQISGVITSIIALLYLKLKYTDFSTIIETYPNETKYKALINYLDYTKLILKIGLISSVSILSGFLALLVRVYNMENFFELLFITSNFLFFLALSLLIIYFSVQRNIVKEIKENIKP